MTSKLVVNTIEADTGISSVSFASSVSMSSTSKFHFSAAGIDIDADTNINRPAAGVLGFNINSSEKMRLDSSGRLLIGTTTEGNESADELTINSSGNTGVTIRSGSSSNGSLFFTDATSGAAEYVGFVQYQHATDAMIFGTSSTEKLRITSGGKISYNYDGSAVSSIADVDIRSNSGVHIRGVDGNNNNANIYIGGAVANQRKTAIIHDPVGGYCRGDLHFCLENSADLSDVDVTDSKMVIKANGDIGIGTNNPQDNLHISNASPGILITDSDQAADTKNWSITAATTQILRIQAQNDSYSGGGNIFDFYRVTNQVNEFRGLKDGNTWFVIDNLNQKVLIGTTNTSNGHISASKAAVHGHLAIFKDSGGDNAGVNSHQLKFVTQSGSIAEIMATSAGAGGPAGRGGYLSLFAKQNNNATLKEMLRVSDSYVTILRENTSLEGGQLVLARASDNAGYWMLDSYGSSSTPDFRIHAGGTSHFSINSSGQWVDAPTGTIINVGYARHDPNSDSYSAISQDTRASSAVYLDFTPRRSDSKLIIMTRMHTRMIAANGCSYGIEQSTNSGGSYSDVDGMNQRNAMDFFYKGDGVNHHYTGFCMRQIDSYSGSRRFRPWGQGWSGGTWEVSYGHGEHSVTIYEVAV